MYMGAEGVHSHTFAYAQKEDCPVCTSTVQKTTLSATTTLNELIQTLKDGSLRLKFPSLVSASGKTPYMQKPVTLKRPRGPIWTRPRRP